MAEGDCFNEVRKRPNIRPREKSAMCCDVCGTYPLPFDADFDRLSRPRCTTCLRQLCERCAAEHARSTSHDVDNIPVRKCVQHPKEYLQVYCYDCTQPMCVLCLSVGHADHQTQYIEAVGDELRKLLAADVETINCKMIEVADFGQRVKLNGEDFAQSIDDVARQVSDVAEGLKKAIDERKRELVQELENVKRVRLDEGQQLCDVIDRQMPQLRGLATKCERCQEIESDVDLTIEFGYLHSSVADVQLLRPDYDAMFKKVSFVVPSLEKFLQWGVSDLIHDEDVAGKDDEAEMRESWNDIKEQMLRVERSAKHDGQGVASEGEMQQKLREKKLFEIAVVLDELVSKEREMNKNMRNLLEDSKELLQKQSEREKQELTEKLKADHMRELEEAVAEVRRVLSSKDQQPASGKVGASVNVAVIGNSGVGKSSLINAIRGLTADDDGAAPVGVVETTLAINSYAHPGNGTIKFWDLPGVGTNIFPQATYLRDVGVEKYDVFLLVSAARFTENDTWLANEISRRGKRYFCVRTKVGVDVRNDKKSHPRTHNEQEVLDRILQTTRDLLRENSQSNVPVLLIDSYEPEKYDFRQLSNMIVTELPEIKRAAEERYPCTIS